MIRVGADADLCIWDEAPAWAIERAQHLGIAGFTPYEGWQARGKPWMTLLRGQVLLNSEGVLEQKPGYGHFLARTSPLPPIADRPLEDEGPSPLAPSAGHVEVARRA